MFFEHRLKSHISNLKSSKMNLLDGKYLSEKLKGEIAEEAAKILESTGRKPHLVAVLVGHDGGSENYVASKMKNCDLNLATSMAETPVIAIIRPTCKKFA